MYTFNDFNALSSYALQVPPTSLISLLKIKEVANQEKIKIDAAVDAYIQKAKDPHDGNMLELRQMGNLLKAKLDSMERMGCTAQDIQRTSNKGLEEIERTAVHFIANTAVSHNAICKLNNQFDEIDSKIHSRQFSKDHFSFNEQPPREKTEASKGVFPQDMLMGLPCYAEQREDMIGLMNLVKGAAVVMNFVGEGLQGVLKEFGENVEHQAQVLCNKNPLLQQRCQQIKSLPMNAIKSLNEVIESTGRNIENKVTEFCDKTLENRKICQTALHLAKGFGQAVQDTEPQFKSGPFILNSTQNISKWNFSFDISQSTKTVDQLWNLEKGSSDAFLSNLGILILSINPSIKEGQLLGNALKLIPSKGQGVASAVSTINNKQYKILTNLFAAQKTASPSWREIEQLFVALGCEIKEGAGSRITVCLKGKEQVFHVPHRHHQVEKYQLAQTRKFLQDLEAIPEKKGNWRIKK